MWTWLDSTISKVIVYLISAGAIFLLGRFWKSLIRPSIEIIWYKGPRLASCYTGEFTLEGEKRTDVIELKQRGYRVWGKITSPAALKQGIYEFEGSLCDNVFRGTYDGTRLKPAVRGSILLTLRPGTDELEGRFIEPVGNDIVSLKYVWIPKGS